MNRRALLIYSLRTALLATAACALPLWYVRRRMQAAKVQANIVSELEELGVCIGYAHEWDHVRNCYSSAGTPGGPLRLIFGDHVFLKPNLVLVSEFCGNALALRDISQLKEITSIGIVDSPNIDDDIIDILLALPELEDASLYATAVTSKGVARLKEHPSLSSIVVSHTRVLEGELDDLRRMMPRCAVYWDDAPNVSVSESHLPVDDRADRRLKML